MGAKKKIIACVSAAALSVMAIASLSGCVVVNVQSPDNGNANTNQNQQDNTDKKDSNTSHDTNFNGDVNDKNENDGKSANEPKVNTNSNGNTNSNRTSDKNSNVNDNKNANTENKEDFSVNWEEVYPAPKDARQKVGKKSTGFISVPEDWKDRTKDDFDERQIEASDITYVVDPTTEFTSGVLQHFAFASSIKMEVFPTDFYTKTEEVVKAHEGDSDYAGYERHNYKLNGKNATLVKYETADGVDVYYVTLAKDEGQRTCDMFTVYSSPSNAKYILGYLGTWTA